MKPARPAYSEGEKHKARQALNSYGASSYSRCFVDPNAVCPVCGQSVYFYSNNFGSRVFFDELGKPWTKHPCTDNGRNNSTAVKARPVSRPLIEIDKILDAEKKIDQRILPASKKARKKSWKLALVTEVYFSDLSMSVLIEDLSTKNHQKHRLQIYCDQQLLNAGDFVSWRGNVFSFLNTVTLESIEIVNGEILLNLDEVEGGIDHNEIPQKISDMVATEKRHFSYALTSNVTVQDELRPVLQDFAKRGIVGAKLVAHYLNATGRKTANGSPWTSRLAAFLILLSGVPQERPHKRYKSRSSRDFGKKQPTKRTKKAKRLKSKRVSVNAKPLQKNDKTPAKLSSDVDEWAKMLSRLGRVTRKGHEE